MDKMLLTAIIFSALTGVTGGWPQAPNVNPPCTGSVIVDAVQPGTLDNLMRAARLIVVGTVIDVLPPEEVDPNHPGHIVTQSIISVDQLLFGTLPTNAKIGLAQIGGKVGRFEATVAGDPVVQKGERYLLFLLADDRPVPPNKTGAARFASLGVGTGKVKIVDGKIQFSCASNPQLRKYDDTELAAFINVLQKLITMRKEGRL